MTTPMIIPAIAPELKPLPPPPPPPPPLLLNEGTVPELGTGGMGVEVTVVVGAEVAREVGALYTDDAEIGTPEENISKPDEISFQRFCTSTGASA